MKFGARWVDASAPVRSLGVSAKPSMSGHPRNVRQSWAEDVKLDKMIVGRESGSPPDAGGTRAGCGSPHRRRHALHALAEFFEARIDLRLAESRLQQPRAQMPKAPAIKS